MRRFFNSFLLLSAIAVVCTGCAKQLKPTGGVVDDVPPKILESSPRNESVNVTESQIEFEFDEYVKLKGANQELVVSPPLKYPVEFKLKGKKLTVIWEDTLTPNTTYLFQFGEGVVDLNEANPLDSNVFVFSTGPYLDSFSLSGKVIDAFTLKPAPDVWVMLYSEDNDSLPYLEIPRYFGKTDENGAFRLNYLSQGNYKVFALLEEGSGYVYDLPTEQIGFIEDMIPSVNYTDTSVQDTLYTIKLFTEVDSTQYLLGTQQLGKNGIQIQFNATVDDYLTEELSGFSSVTDWTPIWNKGRDTLTYWFDKPLDYDSLKLRIVADEFSDTVLLRKPVRSKSRGRGGAKSEVVSDKISLTTGSSLNHFISWRIKSATPISEVLSPEKMIFKEGKDTLDVSPYFSFSDTSLVIDYKWKEDENYSLLIPDSLVFDRFGNSHDTIQFATRTTRKEDFGSLGVEYDLPDLGYGYLWQLKLEDKVIDERIIEPKGSVKYQFLKTGKYNIKILHDENGNGIWDTGFYPGKRQPEKVGFYGEKIEIRSNWETDIEWILLPN